MHLRPPTGCRTRCAASAVVCQLGPSPPRWGLAQTLSAVNRPKEAIATAERAIEVARSINQQATAEQIDVWLKHSPDELQGSPDAGATSKSADHTPQKTQPQ